MTGASDSAALRIQNDKLNSASEHLSSNWIPLNLNLLEEILKKLESSHYENNQNDLVADLKCDIGLLTYTMKELSKMSAEKPASIYESLKKCTSEDLKRIIKKCKQASANNSFLNANSEQVNQLNSLITSTVVTETLAGCQNVDSETAFLCSLFRQAGLCFIAWSYPNIFKNCLHSSANEIELSENLNRALGFSPAMLGLRLAKEWQMPSSVIRIIDLKKPEDPPVDGAAELIIKICKIGELLASLNNDNYPVKIDGAWNHARNEILKNLGSKGFKVIEENIEKVSRYYVRSIPQLAGSGIIQKMEQANKTSSSGSLFHSNAYAQFLSPEMQNDLKDFYSLITPEGLSKDSVTFLHSRLIPCFGFVKGCLYLVDPVHRTLEPRLAFGSTKVSDYQKIDLFAHENSSHPLVKAFNSSTPIPKHEEGSEEIKYFCGSLGSLQRSGVLYLELSPALKKNYKVNPVLLFRALIRGLEDCLGLR